ncbi:hypothetical protein VC83_09579 [Pseudogymnoascus destructans]|uniref:Uncharacterized protein n=1 Tax=Pseudogymnoascus destructans TaxID=655981 RepID=A0A2P6FGE6_9PEZI|nr:uncharacterized protein VC83_09579 [Pseudogymnoascus destructans]PQM43452.1 hypothetical protein VC83_09579 [Pseudogymnoascus destructans]
MDLLGIDYTNNYFALAAITLLPPLPSSLSEPGSSPQSTKYEDKLFSHPTFNIMSLSTQRYPSTNQPPKHLNTEYGNNTPAALGPFPLPDGDSLLWEDIDLHREAVVACPDPTKELDDIQMRGGSRWCAMLCIACRWNCWNTNRK